MLHIIYCLGSLVEPFDTVLPERSLLRCFIQQVQRARKAFEVKHGLEGIGDMQFFDDDEAAPASDKPPEDEAGGDSAPAEEASS